MKPLFSLTLALACCATAAHAQQAVEATLAGHAVVPFNTVATPPADAGAFFATSGKFANGKRVRNEVLGSEAANTFVGDPKYPRASGGALPVKGQAVQGFSGIAMLDRNHYLTLTDNGFGNKINSQDALLMVHRVAVDWAKGSTALQRTIFLHDPDRKVPFAIQNEASAQRYLTGVDFDVESLQLVGKEMWIGDEFGPYLIRADLDGKVLAVYETKVGGVAYRSPDHYLNGRLGNLPSDSIGSWNVRRSGGFEPMAKAPDGSKLYPALEWPAFDAASKGFERAANGKTFTRIFEFDVVAGRYTGKQWKYQFEQDGNVMADFQLLDASTGLLIERDDSSEGLGQVCPGEMTRTDCFNKPAAFKRVYKIDLAQADADGFVKKVAYIDLTRIADPKRASRYSDASGRFGLPHLGPEGLVVVDGHHIVLVNDNNFPYSSGRQLGKPDDNELTLLDIQPLIDAR